jgi:opacity protein-like surface antigen
MAQGRVPRAGGIAASVSLGFFAPDDEFDGALIAGASVEFHPTARVGIRPSIAFTSPDFARDPNAHLRQIRIGVDAVYNWEQGAWHPFAGAGLGVHALELEDRNGTIDDGMELGVSLLGGIEYFASRRTALTFEGRYQFVNDLRGSDPGGFALTMGIKRYF